MNYNGFCQSCGLPMDNQASCGTEKNGSPSSEYCKHCYEKGEFSNPHMTLAGMKDHVRTLMEKEKIPAELVEAALLRLPHLKRWRRKKLPRQKEPLVLTGITPSEKHPLERAPAPGPLAQSEEELDLVTGEDSDEVPGFDNPEPGEGP